MSDSKNSKNVKSRGKSSAKKTTTTTKSRVQKAEGKIDHRTNLIAALGATVVITAILYFVFDWFMALLTAVGLLFIFGFTALMRVSKKNKKSKIIVRIFLIIFLLICIAGVIGASIFAIYIVKEANPKYKPELLKEKQSTILYDSDGKEFAKLGSELRENITYDKLPEIFIDSLIATEDSRFFQHNGVDFARFFKAAVGQVLGHDDAGGGSTITMQVVKNNLTSTTSTGIEGIIRKFSDIYLAVFKVERDYTKEQIIEFYANNHLLGGAWGVEEASKYYFNKSAKDLNISEAALLAGMYQSPSTYNPYQNPNNATARRKTVLNLMVRHGYITREEADLAGSIPVTSLLTYTNSGQSAYQSYIDTLSQEIVDKYGLDPQKTSMLVYTNMNRKKQDAINDVANGKSYKWINDYVQAGVVVIESATGKVEAMIGNRSTNAQKVHNYATSTRRQVGSTAKPLFDYAPGMEFNNWSTYTLFDDSPYSYTNGPAITNSDNTYLGVITLRTALSKSRNIPALKAFQQVEKKKIIELVTSVGITPEIENGTIHEAHAIGAFDGATAMEMAGAYQMFSNGGYYTEPYLVSKIVLRTTGEEIKADVETKRVISDSTAYMITDVLKDVVTNRMRGARYKITDNFAAKTGTTNYDSNLWKRYPGLPSDAIRDCWVMGYTNKTVISLWYGYDKLDPEHLDRVLHWVPATTEREIIFNALANAAFDHDGTDFEMPSSVVKVGVEAGTNPPLLPSANTPSDRIVYELFKKGTEPTEVSNSYSKLDAPTNFSVNYQNNKVTLTWNRVSDPGYIAGGILGYYIYFDDKLVTFTTKTSYTIDNLDNYLGKYTIRAGYKDTSNSMSNPVSRTLGSEKSYSLSLKTNTSLIKVGEGIDKSLYDGSLVILKENGVQVTTNLLPYITVVITDSSGDVVSVPKSDAIEQYTVTYTINYNGYSNSISSKITIQN